MNRMIIVCISIIYNKCNYFYKKAKIKINAPASFIYVEMSFTIYLNKIESYEEVLMY